MLFLIDAHKIKTKFITSHLKFYQTSMIPSGLNHNKQGANNIGSRTQLDLQQHYITQQNSFPPNSPLLRATTTRNSIMTTTRGTSTRLFSSLLPTSAEKLMSSNFVVPGLIGVATLYVLGNVIKYRTTIRKRLKQAKEESWLFGAGLTMQRVRDCNGKKVLLGKNMNNLNFLELNPNFTKKYEQQGWALSSLGDYVSSLRPSMLPDSVSSEKIPRFIQSEIEAGLTTALLTALGPNLGKVLLPAVDSSIVQRKAQGIAANLASKWLWEKRDDGEVDKGEIPIPIAAVLSFSDINAQVEAFKQARPAPRAELSAMQKMKHGEVGGGPSFAPIDPQKERISENADASATEGANLIPNTFVVSRDFEAAVSGMEGLIRKNNDHLEGLKTLSEAAARDELLSTDIDIPESQQDVEKLSKTGYDPDGRKLADPVPVNPRLFPGLHLGWGDAKCSHTNREVVKNRLISLLLNRLGANYHIMANKEKEDIFRLKMTDDGKPITTPWEFVQALLDSGHQIEVCPRTHVTTFGISLSIKEDDESWTNIPLACMLESGYEDPHGKMAPALMPHSGLDMEITGPLIGTRADGTPARCDIQHFIAIDGFCGWHSNHNAEVPWLPSIDCGEPISGAEAVRATRLAGLYANVLNGLGTERNLPFGGYGLTAVCNDSAAVLEQCLYGHSSIYPMTSIGRFMMQSLRYARKLRNQLTEIPGMEKEVDDLCSILTSMRQLPTDLHASPSNAVDAARRMLHCLPKELPFALMEDAKGVMESIVDEEKKENISAKKLASVQK